MTVQQGEFTRTSVHEGVAVVAINRPPLNVLHIPLIRELRQVLETLGDQPEVRAMILRADGRIFSAGVDVADHTPDKVGEMIPLFNDLCHKFITFPVPTLAAVHGDALGGGCELVICCDMAILAEGAKIGQPEIRLAAIAPIAALRLRALVGYRAAAEMLFLGRPLEAGEALRAGLVNALAPKDQVLPWAEEKAAQLAGLSRAAQVLNKRALRLGFERGTAGLKEVEQLYLQELMETADAREGLAAFLEKRNASWKHA